MQQFYKNLEGASLGLGIHRFVSKLKINDEVKKKLRQTLYRTLAFNRALRWNYSSHTLHLATTAHDLIEIFKLRSEIYTQLHYNNAFPDIIDGFNFDHFDRYSAILYTKVNGTVTGTCRIIFDSHYKLPIDSNFSLDYLREQYGLIAEVSRAMIKYNNSGLSQEFRWLTKGVYLITTQNAIIKTVSALKDDHLKLYSKFGGLSVEKRFEIYGNLPNPSVVTLWDATQISNFFKKAFLAN